MPLPRRKQNRLKNFDYGQEGCYFVTVGNDLCVVPYSQNRQRIFNIESVGNDPCVVPYSQNQIIHKWVNETEHKFPNIKFKKYVIMPDHLHFIVNIKERHVGRSLQDVLRYFKTMTTNEYIRGVKDGNLPPFNKKLWQKSYYDHIIRNQADYNEIWEYIENNPQKWMLIHNTDYKI